MPRPDATTQLLQPVELSGRDLWDDLVRMGPRVEHHTTRTILSRSWHWLVPAAVTGVIVAFGLGQPGLWTDELATWGMATTPWSEFWPVLRYVDAVLAPYYVFMHGWVQVFGDSDIALRVPSVLAVAASAGLIGVIGNRLLSSTAGVLSGLVFAFLPSTSRFGAEARPYAFTVVVACLSTWLLLLAWDRGKAPYWILYGLAVAVLGWLHIVAVLLVAAHLWSTLAWRSVMWWRFLLAAGLGIATCTPLLIYGSRQRHQVAYIPAVDLSTFPTYADVVFGGLAIALLLMALTLFCLPLRFPSALFATWAVAPVVALIAVSVVIPMFLPRYLVYTTPGWALMAGAALTRVRPIWMITALTVLAAVAAPAHVRMRGAGGHEQATAQLAAVLAEHTKPGDAVVYADDEPIGAWTTRDTVTHYIAPPQRPRDALATHPPRTAGLLLATECQDVAACLGNVPRVWVVRVGTLADPLAGIGPAKQQWLSRAYTVDQIWYPTGLTLALLERPT